MRLRDVRSQTSGVWRCTRGLRGPATSRTHLRGSPIEPLCATSPVQSCLMFCYFPRYDDNNVSNSLTLLERTFILHSTRAHLSRLNYECHRRPNHNINNNSINSNNSNTNNRNLNKTTIFFRNSTCPHHSGLTHSWFPSRCGDRESPHRAVWGVHADQHVLH